MTYICLQTKVNLHHSDRLLMRFEPSFQELYFTNSPNLIHGIDGYVCYNLIFFLSQYRERGISIEPIQLCLLVS